MVGAQPDAYAEESRGGCGCHVGHGSGSESLTVTSFVQTGQTKQRDISYSIPKTMDKLLIHNPKYGNFETINIHLNTSFQHDKNGPFI